VSNGSYPLCLHEKHSTHHPVKNIEIERKRSFSLFKYSRFVYSFNYDSTRIF